MTRSLRLFCPLLSVPTPEYHVPQSRTHSKSCMLTSVVMLVVVFLQLVEVSPWVATGVQEVQEVVGAVIHHIPDQVARPEESLIERMRELELTQGRVGDYADDKGEGRRQYKPASELN